MRVSKRIPYLILATVATSMLGSCITSQPVNPPSNLPVPGGTKEDAAAATIEGLRKLNHSQYDGVADHRHSIHGDCSVKGTENSFADPLLCQKLLLILVDTQGNEVARTFPSESGQFRFDVSPDRTYSIKTDSLSKWKVDLTPKIPLSAGDSVEVVLYL